MWSIDFLAVDRDSGDLVVIELKRGQTSDATVGQVLRYRNWVQEHLAEGNQHVRGIIVAAEIDDALRYAIKGLPDIAVLTYQVDFRLRPVQNTHLE
jgi:RecB family endonuclease NucS